jgi:isopenicillin N synthase-like dioxygenase
MKEPVNSSAVLVLRQSIKYNFLSARMAHSYDKSRDESATVHQQEIETFERNVPIIDFARIEGPERQRTCKQIAEACETWGFFHLVNHGVDQSLIKRVKDVSMEFFNGPEEEKLKIKVQAPRHDGWNHCEHLSQGNNLIKKDTVEHLFLFYYPERDEDFEAFPQQPESYRSTLVEYTKDLQVLCEKLLGLLSEMLGLAPEAITAALTAGSSTQRLCTAMRTNFYGLKEDGEALPNVCHAHSDPGAITILLADDVPGLEIRKDGEWVKVDPIPGGFIVNVGDMLEIVSNGRYKSVEHRGMPSQNQERLTLATFGDPVGEAMVGPISSLFDENYPPLYQTTQYAAYVAAFVQAGLDGKRGLERNKLSALSGQ